jgi:hypothetical protein
MFLFLSISTLLKAGILNSDALVVVTPEHHEELEDESLYDSENIFAIQHIYRLIESFFSSP